MFADKVSYDQLHSLVDFAQTRMLLPTGFTLIFYVVTVVIYRLRFHPLAKFPGPKLAAATRLYEAYYDVVCGGQYIFKIAQLHRDYGPIIRISPSELHVNDPSFHGKIYNRDGLWNKDPFSYRPFAAEGTGWATAIASMDHFDHKRRRAALNPFFSKGAVTGKLPIVSKHIERLRQSIDAYVESGKILPIGAAFSSVSADIAYEIVLGDESHFLDGEEISENLLLANTRAQALWHPVKHIPGFSYAFILFFITRHLLGLTPADTKSILDFHKKKLARTKPLYEECKTPKQPPPPPSSETLIHRLLHARSLPDADKTFRRLSAEVELVIGAGMETVSHTLRILTFWTYTKPEILLRLREELELELELELEPALHGQQGADDTAAVILLLLRRLEQLPYLSAVITEGLRLNPGLVGRLARIAPDRDIAYAGWRIPAGWPVGMTNYLMHMDERVYPEPAVFEPERWTGVEGRRRLEGAFAPFSKGTRNCVGMHLAYAELYLVLAMVVSRYDFTFVGTRASDVECGSDRFTAGTKTNRGVKVIARRVA